MELEPLKTFYAFLKSGQYEKWTIYDYDVQILSIDGLISAKESAGREKDQPGLKILYALRDSELDEEE